MNKKVVKTGEEISVECSPWLRFSMEDTAERHSALEKKYLTLPEGLDEFEEMITDYRREHGKLGFEEITLMFKAFKKEQRI